MNTKDKVEELKFIVTRFDHYYDSINNKANLYLSINTFFFGGALVGYNSLDKVHHFNSWIVVIILIPFLLSNIISFSFTLSAIRPFTRKHFTKNSMLFFGDVSRMPESKWQAGWESMSHDTWEDDLKCQTQLLAIGLQRKFENLSCATSFLAIQIAIFFIFSVFYYLTYKIQ